MKSEIRNPQSARRGEARRSRAIAFTLIELLVVVTIIVVLLALLVPAMDKAIYQAELTVCATNQKAIATGAVAYATGNRRRYPDRTMSREGAVFPVEVIYNGNPALNAAYNTDSGNVTVYDDRKFLREFVSLNAALNDPLTGAVDWEDLDFDSHAFSTYILWFGFRYNGQAGMMKFGDRLSGRGSDFATRRYDVLVSDRDMMQFGPRRTQTAHPDADGVTTNTVIENGLFDATGMGAPGQVKLTISTWDSPTPRGTVDLNFAFQDGSVLRHDGVEYFDEEFGTLPQLSSQDFNWFTTMPIP